MKRKFSKIDIEKEEEKEEQEEHINYILNFDFTKLDEAPDEEVLKYLIVNEEPTLEEERKRLKTINEEDEVTCSKCGILLEKPTFLHSFPSIFERYGILSLCNRHTRLISRIMALYYDADFIYRLLVQTKYIGGIFGEVATDFFNMESFISKNRNGRYRKKQHDEILEKLSEIKDAISLLPVTTVSGADVKSSLVDFKEKSTSSPKSVVVEKNEKSYFEHFNNINLGLLQSICKILDLDHTGRKKKIIQNILKYDEMCPTMSKIVPKIIDRSFFKEIDIEELERDSDDTLKWRSAALQLDTKGTRNEIVKRIIEFSKKK